MLYLFSGTDTFRMLEQARVIEREFLRANLGGQKLVFDAEDAWDEETRSLLVSTLSPGLFATPYCVIIRGTETLDEKAGAWLGEALAGRDSLMQVVLIFAMGNKKKLPKWWQALAKTSDVKEEVFAELSPKECMQYIDTLLQSLDGTISIEPRAKSFLAENFLHDTGRLKQELTRLSLAGDGKTITAAQTMASVTPTKEAVTFQALDALVRGDRARAIALFRQEETEPDAPFALLGLCAWQVRRLIAIKELSEEGKDAGTIARELKTSPYPIQKTLPLVTRFSFPRLRQALTLLADFDLALKTGRMQPGVALDLFVWKF